VNLSTKLDIQLEPSADTPGFFDYDNTSFFPIDGRLFGNQGRPHNYHFTLEAHTDFKYVGGELFSFVGDDDVWVFVNKRLAIDLGGTHSAEEGSIDLDANSDLLEIKKGNVYALDLFFAERHTVASDFSIHTSIADQGSCE